MCKTTAILTPVADDKRTALPKKEQDDFLIPDDIKTALVQRIQTRMLLIEKEIKSTDAKMNEKCSLIKKIEFQFKMAAIKKQHDFLVNCVSVDVDDGSEKDAAYLDDAYQKYQSEIKELSQRIIKTEEDRLKARVDAEAMRDIFLISKEEKDDEYKVSDKENLYLYRDPINGKPFYFIKDNARRQYLTLEISRSEFFSNENKAKCKNAEIIIKVKNYIKASSRPVIEEDDERVLLQYKHFLQVTMPSITNEYKTLKNPTVEKARNLLSDCSDKLIAISTEYSSYSKKRKEYENKIASLSDDRNSFVALRKLCEKNELTLQELQKSCFLKYFLLDKDTINVKDTLGFIPLHYACLLGNIELAEGLVKLGSKIDSRSHDGNYPVQFVARICEETTKRFLQLLLPVNKQDYMKLENCKMLGLAAADYGNLAIIDFLLNSATMQKNESNILIFLSVLLTAATKGHTAIVTYLLEKPCIKSIIKYEDEDLTDVFKKRLSHQIEHALGRAYYYGQVEVVLAFFKAGITENPEQLLKYLDKKIRHAIKIGGEVEGRKVTERIESCEFAVDRLKELIDMQRHKQRLETRRHRLQLFAKNLNPIPSRALDFSVINPASIATEVTVIENSRNEDSRHHPAFR